jgi:hypothetical protein
VGGGAPGGILPGTGIQAERQCISGKQQVAPIQRAMVAASGSSHRRQLLLGAAATLLVAVCMSTGVQGSRPSAVAPTGKQQQLQDPPYTWKPCQAGLPFELAGVQLTPGRPHHGRTMTFRIDGTSKIAVQGGRFSVIVYYRGWHVWSEAQDVCSAVQCLVQAGQSLTIASAHKLPVVAPPGPYEMKFSGQAQGNISWFCVKVYFHVTSTR